MARVYIRRIYNNTSGAVSYKNTVTSKTAVVKAKDLPDDRDYSDDLNDEIPEFALNSGRQVEIQFNNLSPSKITIKDGAFYLVHMSVDIEPPEEVYKVGQEAKARNYVVFLNEVTSNGQSSIELDIVAYEEKSWEGGAPAASALAALGKFISVLISKFIKGSG